MAENTNAGTPAGNDSARAPAVGEPGFTPHPHAEDAELAALEAEIAAAQDAPAAEPDAPVAPAAEPAAAGAAEAEGDADPETEGEQPRGKDGKWIPKARFDEQVAREREKGNLAAQLAYFKGKAEALEASAKAGGKPADQALTPEQEVAAIEDAILAKATDFDEGRIGMAEFKRFERQAQARLDTLRAPPAARDEAPSDMRLQELTLALPERFPVLTQLTAAHVHRLQPVAEAELQFEGVAIDSSPRSVYALRERIAQLAQARFGTAAAQPQQTPAAATRPTNVNKAVAAKLDLAARMPPNLNKTGTAQMPQDRFSAESIEKMDLDEIATAVPDSILRQLSGQ